MPKWVDGTTEFHRICLRYIQESTAVLELGAGPKNKFLPFMAYERVVNASVLLSPLRANIFCVAKKVGED